MFDLRYHVASLAAVFVALIVGILVGVGLAGSGVNKTDLSLAQAQRDDARANLDAAQAQVAQLKKTSDAFERAYPAMMRNLLTDKRVAVLFVGSADGGVKQAIDNTLHDAGAPPSVRMLSVSVPVNAESLDGVLTTKGAKFVKYVGDEKLDSLGNALGGEFVRGGQTPLWKALGRQLIAERSGDAKQRVDGVVVVRTAKPQQGGTARFLHGLYSGIASAGIPVVGVEKTGSSLSAVDVYRDHGLSAVDDIDKTTGRAALALLLAGAAPGAYGTGHGADAILPNLSG